MLKYLKLLTTLSITLLLSSCMVGIHKSMPAYFAKREISNEQLTNGRPVKVGAYQPPADWLCNEVASNSYNWATIKFKTMNWNSYGYLRKQALSYASQRNLKINYIYMHLPETVSLGAVDLSAVTNEEKADIFYYQCDSIKQ